MCPHTCHLLGCRERQCNHLVAYQRQVNVSHFMISRPIMAEQLLPSVLHQQPIPNANRNLHVVQAVLTLVFSFRKPPEFGEVSRHVCPARACSPYSFIM